MNNIDNPEKILREKMLRQVAGKYDIFGPEAERRIEALVLNIPALRYAILERGYYYGQAPHNIKSDLRDEIREVGRAFITGTRTEQENPALSVGLDILKCLAVAIPSLDYDDWSADLKKYRINTSNLDYK